jgi:predicted nuclease of predicted toxin-antitoxin system
VLKFLFDENLSARLVTLLSDRYPGSAHLEHLGLLGATDLVVWSRAGSDGFVLVTKDEDFHRLSVLRGPPPKVVWLRTGNCTTMEAARLIREHHNAIAAFVAHEDAAFLVIG